MKINLIAAVSENKIIGKNNTLPWYISEDLKRFRKLTTGHPIIMGRKTYESIGKPLPHRTNIVITKDPEYQAHGVALVHSLEEALKTASKSEGSEEVFIIGGGQIFKEAISIADKLYLTVIHKQIEGDIYFPDYSAFTTIIHSEDGEEGDLKYTFLVLER